MADRAKSVHVPVLFKEVMEALRVSSDINPSDINPSDTLPRTFLDCTVGGAGHLLGILNGDANNNIVGLDRDPYAVDLATRKLTPYKERVRLFNQEFSELENLKEYAPFFGILADFGLSSDQLKEPRGFSFRRKEPLDMRMNVDGELTADIVVNTYSPKRLLQILSNGGVRKNIKRYVNAIINARPVADTSTLAQIISENTPYKDKKETHPATVVFQAIRIEVNGELEEITSFLTQIPSLVEKGGRLVCISFHSLEDLLVAKAMRKWQGESGPANWPGGHALGSVSLGKLLTRKATTPTAEEIEENPRARSARMRVFEFH